MPKKIILQISMVAVAAAFLCHPAVAQNAAKTGSGEEGKSVASGETMDRMKVLRAAADALGMIRWSDIAAGDKTKISMENGMTVLTFPLSGSLAGITVRATLDSKNFVIRVETKPDNPALTNLVREVEYSDYADHGEVLTDIKSPGHVSEK